MGIACCVAGDAVDALGTNSRLTGTLKMSRVLDFYRLHSDPGTDRNCSALSSPTRGPSRIGKGPAQSTGKARTEDSVLTKAPVFAA